MPWVPPMFRPLERNMLDLDPPDHTRLRALVQKAFTPRLVERMRGGSRRWPTSCSTRPRDRGEIDLIRDYALPLPMTVITEILGVPAARPRQVPPLVEGHRLGQRLQRRLADLPERLEVHSATCGASSRVRRAEPRDDLTSALIRAEEAGDRLSEDELLAMVFLLLIAGHETTVNLIASGALALLRHPDQWTALRRDPALIESRRSRSCCGSPRRCSWRPSATPART